jgi:hypothetical protein
MIATGVLDYSLAPNASAPTELALEDDDGPNDVSKASS